MKANSDKSKQSNKATRRVLAGVLCGASVLSLVLSLVMPPISQAIANDAQAVSTEKTVTGGGSSSESTDVDNTNNGDTENQNSDDAGNDASEDTVAADSTADGAEVKGAEQPFDAQPSDNENSDENAIAPVSTEDYKKVEGNVANAFVGGGKYRLSGKSWSDSQITITANTTIDLNGNMLYHGPGSVGSFIVVQNNATLTIEDLGQTTKDAPSPVDTANTSAGQPASIEWERGSGSNKGTPKSLTYFETVSEPTENGFGTTETTTKHVLTGFGAIDAASDNGSVENVINVNEGCVLNLKGGMITTAASLKQYGQVIKASGTVNISGGYIAGGNCDNGGWGGGLCVTGANASLNMTGGVIAANKAASGGGIYANLGAKLNLSGGVISGNATYGNVYNEGGSPNNGYGGGVFTKGANVSISGLANITNNRVDSYINDSNIYNKGLLGGGGIASVDGGTLTMEGGSVTANYSKEAGGGIYAGFWDKKIQFTMTGGTIAGNESLNGEGGGLRIAGGNSPGMQAKIEATPNSKIYITNNKTMTGVDCESGGKRGGDWGGGGVFVQKGGRLNIFKTLITNNRAGGWGGGVGACPTGETIVSHSNGAAIYDNTDNVNQDGKKLPDVDQNEHKHPAYHYSAGGDNKTEDRDEVNYVTHFFQNSGHEDFFLVRNKNGADKTIAVVLGKMLGGESAGWQGTCDGNPVTIDPNGGAEAKYMFGLKANPTPYAKDKAQTEATTIISGNYSYTHGGGIMTNGDLVVGEVKALNVYPAIKVKANKVLMKDGKEQGLSGHNYQFKLLGAPADPNKAPYWNNDGTLNENGCEAKPAVPVNENGEILIDTGANYQSGDYDLYLVEVPIKEEGTTFDKAIYKIHIKVGTTPVNWTDLLGIHINRYAVNKDASTVSVKKEGAADFINCGADFYSWTEDSATDVVSTVTIGNNSSPAFANELAPYQTSGTWTPQVTKKVDGGEMKKFKFELYTKDASGNKQVLDTKYTSKGTGNEATVTFEKQTIGPLGIKDLAGGKATVTYYICECDADKKDGTKHEGYVNDTKTFKVVVTATDDDKGHLTCTPTYYEVDANNMEQETDNPTFTNTYSTSLPLSGMSGVTLTYLAGAAVLCAAAAWMHIRRKANAKGGERRE